MKFLTFLLFIIIVTSNSLAADWVLIATSKGGTKHYIDKASLSKDGDYIVYWKRVVYPDIKISSYGSVKNIKAKRVLDCDYKKDIVIYAVAYDENGNKASEDSKELNYHKIPQEKWDDVVPGSINEKSYDYICNLNVTW